MGAESSNAFRHATDFLGATTPKEAYYIYDEHGKRKHYMPPHHRKEARGRAEVDKVIPNAIDAQIDKYDYVIVFPWAETGGAVLDDKEFKSGNFLNANPEAHDSRRSITWGECEDIWHDSIVGTNEVKDQACLELRQFMRERFAYQHTESTGSRRGGHRGHHEDTVLDKALAAKPVYYHAWLALVREAICDRLCTKAGFQIKLTEKSSKVTKTDQRGGRVLCRLRAPVSRLEALADELNYKLQLREEVDPGSEEFWNKEDENKTPIEVEEDHKLYEKHEAEAILKELCMMGLISKSEVEVNFARENQASWSRRIHVLERIADKVPVYNKYPAYAPFTTQPKLRYLFKEYSSVRGRTLFRSKDRLYLTKLLIEKYFDLEVFMRHGSYFEGTPPAIESYSALHDANRGDEVNLDMLFRVWVTFFRANAREVGVPYVSHIGYEGNQYATVNIFQRPFSQPLNHIREYFGEKIALLFAWHGMYTYYLIVPFIFGLAMEGIYVYRGYVDTIDNIDWPLQVFNFMVIVWASVYIQHWAAEQQAISARWGTEDFEETEKDRPQFHGDDSEGGEMHQMSFVTNEPELYYPEEKRFQWQLITGSLVFLATLFNCALIGAVFYAEYLVEDTYTEYEFYQFKYVVAIVLAVEISVTSVFFFRFVTMLNDWENHQTNSQYEDALVQKVLAFQMFNYYGALLFTAFGKGYVFDDCTGTCMEDMRILLYCILAVRGAEMVLDLLFNMLLRLWYSLFVAAEGSVDRESESEETPLLGGGGKLGQQSQQAEIAFMTEIDKTEFTDRDIFDLYSDVVIQFGYLTFFSVAFPMMSGILLLESLFKVRLNALKLCSLRRRPHVQLAEDIGKWENLIVAFNILGIVASVGILTFTTEQVAEYDMTEQALIFLLHEFGLILVVVFITKIVPNTPAWLEDIRERNKFVVNKWVNGNEEYEVNVKLDTEGAEDEFDDNIDVELLQLSGSLKGMNDEDMAMNLALRKERRNKLKEIHEIRSTISQFAHLEKYDEISGISIDPQSDFALGMLQLKLNTMINNEETRKLVDKYRRKKADHSRGHKKGLTNIQVPSDAQQPQEDEPLDLGVRMKVSVIGHDRTELGRQYTAAARDNKLGTQSYLFEEALPAFSGIGTRLAMVVFELVLNADMDLDLLLAEREHELDYAAHKAAGLENEYAAALEQQAAAAAEQGGGDSSPRSPAAARSSRRLSVLPSGSSTTIGAAGGGVGMKAFSNDEQVPKSNLPPLKTPSVQATPGPGSINNPLQGGGLDAGGAQGHEDEDGFMHPITSTLAGIPLVGQIFETEADRAHRLEEEEMDAKLALCDAELARLKAKLVHQFQNKEPEVVLVMTSFDLNEPIFNDQVDGKLLVLPMYFLAGAAVEAGNNVSVGSYATPMTAVEDEMNGARAGAGSSSRSLPGKESRARLNMEVTFKYSKLAMTRNKIAVLQKELSDIERQIATLKVSAERSHKEKVRRDEELKRAEKEKERLQLKEKKSKEQAGRD